MFLTAVTFFNETVDYVVALVELSTLKPDSPAAGMKGAIQVFAAEITSPFGQSMISVKVYVLLFL